MTKREFLNRWRNDRDFRHSMRCKGIRVIANNVIFFNADGTVREVAGNYIRQPLKTTSQLREVSTMNGIMDYTKEEREYLYKLIDKVFKSSAPSNHCDSCKAKEYRCFYSYNCLIADFIHRLDGED